MYEYTLVHKAGSAHCNADALSRLPLPNKTTSTPQLAETVLLFEQLQSCLVTVNHIKTQSCPEFCDLFSMDGLLDQ